MYQEKQKLKNSLYWLIMNETFGEEMNKLGKGIHLVIATKAKRQSFLMMNDDDVGEGVCEDHDLLNIRVC